VCGSKNWDLVVDPRLESRFTQPSTLSLLRDYNVSTPPRRMDLIEVKRRRMENLMEMVKDEYDSPPEREPSFFNDNLTRRVGLVFMKPHLDEAKEQYFVHFMKLATGDSDRDSVFMKVSYTEALNFVEILKRMQKEMDDHKLDTNLSSLAKSPYAEYADYTDPKFWHKNHTEYLSSGRLAIRPHRHPDGYFTVKILQPKKSNTTDLNRAWLGRKMTLAPGHLRKFKQHMLYFTDYLKNITAEEAEDHVG